MKLFVALLCACTPLAFSPGAAAAEKGKRPVVADTKVFGEYPMGYELIITNFVKERLIDPASAKIVFDTEPKPAKLTLKGRRELVGYSVNFKVNSRNRFGMYTGNQPYRVLIRNGDVIHVERPDPRKR